MSLIRVFLADEKGASAIEYGMIGAIISVAILTGATAIGSKLYGLFLGPIGNGLN